MVMHAASVICVASAAAHLGIRPGTIAELVRVDGADHRLIRQMALAVAVRTPRGRPLP
jgi:hypothetical protein